MKNRCSKRIFDLLASVPGLLFISPVGLLIAFLVRIKLGSPVIFCQVRPGLHGQPFTMYKFRTMTEERDSKGELLSDVKRLTPFGKLLRSTSLDELPALINVIKGEMSLVGPRPLLMEYLPKYSHEQARRHEVLPGITGLAQISGRQNIPFSKRIEYDVWYVDNQSIFLDSKILWKTTLRVVKKDGYSSTQEIEDVDDIGLNS